MGFFDALTNIFQPISKPLVSFSSQLSGSLLDTVTHTNLPSQTLARPDVQTLGQQLFAVGSVAGLAIGGAAVAAPLLAGAGGAGGLGSLGGLGASAAGLLPQINQVLTADETGSDLNDDAQDIFYNDSYDSTDSGAGF